MAKNGKSTTQPPAAPKKGDAGALAKLAKIEKRFRALSAADTRDRWQEGQALLPVREQRLYAAKGYKSFQEYCEKELGVDRQLGIQLTDAAKAFSEEQFAHLGQTHARLGLMLLNATPEKDTVADLDGMVLRYGSGKGKKFLDATARELLEDLRGERGKDAQQGEKSFPPGIRRLASREERAAGDGVKVKLRFDLTDTGGRVLFDVFGLPTDGLARVLGTMAKAARAGR